MPRTFETEREGRVLTVRFDNPPLNFMDRVMVAELDELLDSLEGERSVGSVVLTGKPEGLFITHYDIEEILAGSESVGRAMSAGVAAPRADHQRGGAASGSPVGASADAGVGLLELRGSTTRSHADGQGVHRGDQRPLAGAASCRWPATCAMAEGADRFGLPG
jgi:hypothetical protein